MCEADVLGTSLRRDRGHFCHHVCSASFCMVYEQCDGGIMKATDLTWSRHPRWSSSSRVRHLSCPSAARSTPLRTPDEATRVGVSALPRRFASSCLPSVAAGCLRSWPSSRPSLAEWPARTQYLQKKKNTRSFFSKSWTQFIGPHISQYIRI